VGGGDREPGALSVGIEGCPVLRLRLDPQMSGRATLMAGLGPRGEVLWAEATRVENLPRPVVACLVARVQHTRFTPRGAGTEVRIPIDFSRPTAVAPVPTKEAPPPAGTQML